MTTVRQTLALPFRAARRVLWAGYCLANQAVRRLTPEPTAAPAPASPPAPPPAPPTEVDVDALIIEMARMRSIAAGAAGWALPSGLYGDPRPSPPEGAAN